MAENHQDSTPRHHLYDTPLGYEGEEHPDKARDYTEFRESAKECKEAHSLRPGHMFHSWKCRHDTSSFMMIGIKGSMPWQQFQTYNRDNWTWKCINCAKVKVGEAFPTDHDVDGCPGAQK
jgi:hypothetical protein